MPSLPHILTTLRNKLLCNHTSTRNRKKSLDIGSPTNVRRIPLPSSLLPPKSTNTLQTKHSTDGIHLLNLASTNSVAALESKSISSTSPTLDGTKHSLEGNKSLPSTTPSLTGKKTSVSLTDTTCTVEDTSRNDVSPCSSIKHKITHTTSPFSDSVHSSSSSSSSAKNEYPGKRSSDSSSHSTSTHSLPLQNAASQNLPTNIPTPPAYVRKVKEPRRRVRGMWGAECVAANVHVQGKHGCEEEECRKLDVDVDWEAKKDCMGSGSVGKKEEGKAGLENVTLRRGT